MKPHRTDIDMEKFRALLMKERDRILGLHEEQRSDMLAEASDVSENELSVADYNEPADFSAALADRDRDAAQDANLKGELHQIERALDKIDNGSYGICEITGKPIPVERLRALPWARTIIEVADQVVY